MSVLLGPGSRRGLRGNHSRANAGSSVLDPRESRGLWGQRSDRTEAKAQCSQAEAGPLVEPGHRFFGSTFICFEI